MKEILRYSWVIILDILAVILLLFALLFGWLPGAPGIPIALAGLGLLAINHDWAKELLKKLKLKAVDAKKWLKSKLSKK